MSPRLIALVVVTGLFAVLTVEALLEVGYLGLFEMHMQNLGGTQVLVDLVILALMSCAWMVQDARERGANAWPFVVLTLVGGSFGPLLYLIVREARAPQARLAAAAGR